MRAPSVQKRCDRSTSPVSHKCSLSRGILTSSGISKSSFCHCTWPTLEGKSCIWLLSYNWGCYVCYGFIQQTFCGIHNLHGSHLKTAKVKQVGQWCQGNPFFTKCSQSPADESFKEFTGKRKSSFGCGTRRWPRNLLSFPRAHAKVGSLLNSRQKQGLNNTQDTTALTTNTIILEVVTPANL